MRNKQHLFAFILLTLLPVFGFSQNNSEVKIAGIKGKNINTDLMIERGIYCAKSEDVVLSFKVSVVVNGENKEFKSSSNQFTADFLSFCPSIPSGSILKFDSIALQSKSKVKYLPAVEYTVKREAVFSFMSKNKFKTEFSVDEILFYHSLNCYPETYKVISFDLLIIADEQVQRFIGSFNGFSSEMVEAIGKLKGGEVLWFQNIETVFNSTSYWIQPFKLNVIASNKNFPCTLNGISFGEWKNQKVEKEYILKVPSKEVEIQSFSMTSYAKGVVKTLKQPSGSKLTSEMVTMLNSSTPSTVIKIDQIKSKKEDVVIRLEPIYLRIPGDIALNKAVIGKTFFGEQSFDYITSNPTITIDGKTASSFMARTTDEHLFSSSDGKMSDILLDMMKNLPKGTVLQFYNILRKDQDKLLKANDVWIKIK